MPENTEDISNIFANTIQPTAEEQEAMRNAMFGGMPVQSLNKLMQETAQEGENNNNKCGKQNN